MGSDPEQLAATLRGLGCLDPVELGLEVVLERIVKAAATGCDSTGGVGLLLLGPDGQLRYVVAAGRPRRSLAGTQVRLAQGPSVDAFVQAAPVSSSDLAAEPRWPDFRPLAQAAGIRAWLSVPVHQHHGPSARSTSPAPTPGRGSTRTWRPPTPTPSGSWRPCGRPPHTRRSGSPRRCGSRPSTTPGSSRRGRPSCSANGSTRPLRSSCSVYKPRSRANRSEPSPNASSPAPDADRHPSAARRLPRRPQPDSNDRHVRAMVQTVTLPGPWPAGWPQRFQWLRRPVRFGLRAYPLLGWQPSRFLTDQAEAQRAFQLAERLGSVNAAANELGTTWPPLRKAFQRHGLGMPARNPEAVRQRALAAASQPAAPPPDPVFVALNQGQLPDPRGPHGEQGCGCVAPRRSRRSAIAPWSSSTPRAGPPPSGGWPPSPAAPNAPIAWPVTGPAVPTAASSSARPAASAPAGRSHRRKRGGC